MAKKKKTKRPASARYSPQVDAESKLKFGPEESSLRAQLADAETTRDQAYAGAGGVRAAIEGSAKAALPKLRTEYGTAQRAVDTVQKTLGTALTGAGSLGGAAIRDSEGTKMRLAEALAAAEAETTARQRDASSGEAFARQNADSQLATTKGKIGQRQTDLAGERGAFAQARSGELVEASRGRSVTRRGQDKTAATARDNRIAANTRADRSAGETARHNRATERQARKNGGTGLAKPADVEKARTAVNRAMDSARAIAGEVSAKDKAGGKKMRDRADAAKILVNGRAGQTIKNDPKSGEPLANPIKVPGVNKQDQLYASVALDMLYDGRISKGNQARLSRLGLTPKQLGLRPAYGNPTRPGTAPAGRVGRGQQRPT